MKNSIKMALGDMIPAFMMIGSDIQEILKLLPQQFGRL
jgi:hypothetical protein